MDTFCSLRQINSFARKNVTVWHKAAYGSFKYWQCASIYTSANHAHMSPMIGSAAASTIATSMDSVLDSS